MKTTVDSSAAIAGGISLLVTALVILILSPLAVIWGWNTLFGDIKVIDYTIWNWLAVVALSTMFRSHSAKVK